MSASFKRIRVVKQENHVAEVILCCPQRLNSMDLLFFSELEQAFVQLSNDNNVHAVVLWSEGKAFTSGLDLKSAMSILLSSSNDESSASPAIQNLELLKKIQAMQAPFSAIAKCKKPVITAIQGPCIGGGIDMVSACDVRLGTRDSTYSIRETKLAIVADLGTLQRIQRVVGKGFAREMAFTGSDYDAKTLYQHGFLNHVYESHEECLKAARTMAANIASNSPLVVQGTKYMLNYAEEHTTDDGLMHVALWNSALIKSEDLTEAVMSYMEKRKPKFINKL